MAFLMAAMAVQPSELLHAAENKAILQSGYKLPLADIGNGNSIIATASASSQAQKQIPTSREVIEMAEKALGGDEFFKPKPYTLNVLFTGKDSYDGIKTVNRADTYKDGKYYSDGSVSFLSKKHLKHPILSKRISNLNSGKNWESLSSMKKGVWRKVEYAARPEIPCLNQTTWNNLVFDTETPDIIKQGGVEYYKLSAKRQEPEFQNYRYTYLIDTKSHLVYKTEAVKINSPYKFVRIFMDYANVNGVAIPQRILSNGIDDDGGKYEYQTTYSNFTFRDDIPDSLFEIPINNAQSLETVTKRRNTEFQFKTSTAHPEWQSPDHELESRLKNTLVNIVNNFPDRHANNPETLNKLGSHIKDILSATGGRVTVQEFDWVGDTYYNVIASYGPESGPRIVIGAHYDAVQDSPGADDNASAVAVLLELAKMLGKNPPPIRVDLAAYTLEEDGCLGSVVHAKALKADNIDVKAMISLEMVGYFSDEPKSQRYPLNLLKLFYPSKGNFICVTGKTGLGGLTKTIKKAMSGATPLPVRTFKAPASMRSLVYTVGRSDHSSFWAQGYPAVMLTDTAEFRNRNYHQETDAPELLDYRRMAMVTVGVEKAIRALCK
jgi:hypothetical protein